MCDFWIPVMVVPALVGVSSYKETTFLKSWNLFSDNFGCAVALT